MPENFQNSPHNSLAMHFCILGVPGEQELIMRRQSSILLQCIVLFVMAQMGFGSLGTDFPRNCLPFTCTNGFQISYPFWNTNSSDSATNHCGYPGLGISCTQTKPTLHLSGNDYYINKINYKEKSLYLEEVWDDPLCPWPKDFDSSSMFLLVNPQKNNTMVYFYSECSDQIMRSNWPKLRCQQSRTILRTFHVVTDLWTPSELPKCKNRVLSPLLNSSVQRLEGGSWEDALRNGFMLQWRPDAACKYCELSGGRCRYGFDRAEPSFICSCPQGQEHPRDCNEGRGGLSFMEKVAIIGGTQTFIAGFMVAAIICIFRKKLTLLKSFLWKKKSSHNVEIFLKRYGLLAPRRYSYSEVKKITCSFRDKLGQGGYGSVFKGELPDGRIVAVKVLKNRRGNGEEFINEVATIGQTNHLNIVSLLGFCSEGSKRALIYEYMPNGSLEKFIFTSETSPTNQLEWEKLYQIALGIARGLEYLHFGCNTRILHFDIKPHNILLDRDFCPKISDFGLAESYPSRDSIMSMFAARGTVGYIAPEVCFRNYGCVSYKSDVYSYGMMVLEMAGGRKNLDVGVENTSQIYYPRWIYDHLEKHKYLGFESIENGEEGIAKKMLLVGLWCIQTNPAIRPSMSRVVEMLEGSIDKMQFPPKPMLDVI